MGKHDSLSSPAGLGGEALLIRSLQSGAGHVAIIGQDRSAARAHARKALVNVNALAVLHVSAIEPPTAVESPASEPTDSDPGSTPARTLNRVRNLMAPLLDQAAAVGKPALIVVEDADAGDAAALERIRTAVECAPDSIKWLRIVLIGDERLEKILDDPATSALASRICARVRVPKKRFRNAAPATRGLRRPVLAALSLALVATSLWYVLPVNDQQSAQRPALATAAQPTPAASSAPIAVATAPSAVQPGAPTIREDTPAAPAASPAPIVTAMASSVPSPSAENIPTAPQKAPAVELNAPAAQDTQTVGHDTHAVAQDAPAAAEDTNAATRDTQAAAQDVRAPAPDTQAEEGSKPAAAPEKTVTESERPRGAAAVDAKPAVAAKPAPKVAARKAVPPAPAKASKPPAAPASRASAQAPAHASSASVTAVAEPPMREGASVSDADAGPSREVVLEAGSFADAKRAYALRYDLGERLGDDHVLVARLDPPDGPPAYSVRVVGLASSREVADAEATLHSLGHDPVRYEKPGTFARLGRKMRPIWAGLFSR